MGCDCCDGCVGAGGGCCWGVVNISISISTNMGSIVLCSLPRGETWDVLSRWGGGEGRGVEGGGVVERWGGWLEATWS